MRVPSAIIQALRTVSAFAMIVDISTRPRLSPDLTWLADTAVVPGPPWSADTAVVAGPHLVGRYGGCARTSPGRPIRRLSPDLTWSADTAVASGPHLVGRYGGCARTSPGRLIRRLCPDLTWSADTAVVPGPHLVGRYGLSQLERRLRQHHRRRTLQHGKPEPVQEVILLQVLGNKRSVVFTCFVVSNINDYGEPGTRQWVHR